MNDEKWMVQPLDGGCWLRCDGTARCYFWAPDAREAQVRQLAGILNGTHRAVPVEPEAPRESVSLMHAGWQFIGIVREAPPAWLGRTESVDFALLFNWETFEARRVPLETVWPVSPGKAHPEVRR